MFQMLGSLCHHSSSARSGAERVGRRESIQLLFGSLGGTNLCFGPLTARRLGHNIGLAWNRITTPGTVRPRGLRDGEGLLAAHQGSEPGTMFSDRGSMSKWVPIVTVAALFGL